ncbi:MAG: ATP-grasp domain-containing protein [Bacteroidota bacterium]
MSTNRAFSALVLDLDDFPRLTLTVIRALGRIRGIRVTLASRDSRNPAKSSRWCKSFEYIPPHVDERETLGQIDRVIARQSIDVILPIGDRSVSFISRHVSALSTMCAVTPVPRVEDFELAVDKWRFTQYLVANKISCPKSLHCSSVDDLERASSELEYPVLLKPRRGHSGHGIERFASFIDLKKHFQSARANPGDYILQEVVEGHDFGCNVLSWEGEILAYTLQRGELQGSTPYGAPAGVRFIDDEDVYNAATAFPARIRWNGVMNLDLRHDRAEGVIKVLEANPRYWRSLMGSVVAGVNFPYLACLKALQLPVPPGTYNAVPFIHENGVAAHQIIQQLLRRRKKEYRFRDTSLRFAAQDPIPDVLLLTNWFL